MHIRGPERLRRSLAGTLQENLILIVKMPACQRISSLHTVFPVWILYPQPAQLRTALSALEARSSHGPGGGDQRGVGVGGETPGPRPLPLQCLLIEEA